MAIDWEARYQAKDTPWEKGEAAPPLREFLQENSVTGRTLIPGCGAGFDARLLAAQGAEVVGVDIAPSGIERARSFPPVRNEIYLRGDFLDREDERLKNFDWIFEHTCLCAIEPDRRLDYARAAHAALKPGGKLLAIFYKVVEDYDGSGPPHPIDDEAIDALFSDGFHTSKIWTPTQAYPSRAGGKEQMRLMEKRV